MRYASKTKHLLFAIKLYVVLLLAVSLASCGIKNAPICEIDETVVHENASVTVEYAFGTKTEAYVVFSVKADDVTDDDRGLYLPSVIIDINADGGYGYGCIDRSGSSATYILAINSESGSLTGKKVNLQIGGIHQQGDVMTTLCDEDFVFDFRLNYSEDGKTASVGETDNHPMFLLLLTERALIITPDRTGSGGGDEFYTFSDVALVKYDGDSITPDINSSNADSPLAFTVCLFGSGIDISEIEKAVIDGIEIYFDTEELYL
ncbi:MAG: hypothetical protein LUI15_01805 [Firmicutes bacterium]|nr:hypothetical protein [Bacillota bacterium]